MFNALLLLACTATIRATATPESASIYLTNEKPSTDARPTAFVAKGTGELDVRVKYYTWQEWYLWVSAPGYATQVVQVPTEPKVGPIVGAVLVWFPAVWAIGPDDDAMIEVELRRGR
jgi:hypothetical protein